MVLHPEHEGCINCPYLYIFADSAFPPSAPFRNNQQSDVRYCVVGCSFQNKDLLSPFSFEEWHDSPDLCTIRKKVHLWNVRFNNCDLGRAGYGIIFCGSLQQRWFLLAVCRKVLPPAFSQVHISRRFGSHPLLSGSLVLLWAYRRQVHRLSQCCHSAAAG